MKKSFNLSVPKPCHEKWEEFAPTSSGGFCASCQKEVIDFTTWDEYRIKQYFKNQSGSSCGRFKSTQLKTYVIETRPSYSFSKWIPASLITAFVAFYSGKVYAVTNGRKNTEQIEVKTKKTNFHPSDSANNVSIKGIVLSSMDSLPLPGVNVIINGTSTGTFTDTSGYFELKIGLINLNDTLAFSAVGFYTMEKSINTLSSEIWLEPDLTPLSEITVTAGAICYTPYSPKYLTWRFRNLVRNLFRRD